MIDILIAMVQLTAIGLGVALLIACLTAPKQVLKYAWKILVEMKNAYWEYQKKKEDNI